MIGVIVNGFGVLKLILEEMDYVHEVHGTDLRSWADLPLMRNWIGGLISLGRDLKSKSKLKKYKRHAKLGQLGRTPIHVIGDRWADLLGL
nr:hypothetical protein Itr_chr15CG13530 [Ipomoea trifida]